ncbi:insulin receptor [Galendromus occidentalis]|uniref:receptor protein-tyrosine kinase n=1 Tax=Galendromus occidentalis TaxID=34638 RepID=A0AAJ7PB53_9ACAR|nr:insulin receptor [Galendromus occidentalis]
MKAIGDVTKYEGKEEAESKVSSQPLLAGIICCLVSKAERAVIALSKNPHRRRVSIAPASTTARQEGHIFTHSDLLSTVCSTLRAKTQLDRLEHLRNCSVIEGSLALAVMQYRNESRPDDPDVLNMSFPELREITGFLLVFRSHFTNLTKLFPNLAVIRGLELFDQYALIIYENPLMTTLGLSNLTTIQRGGVRIEKNQRLCHVHSIKWDRIVQSRSKILLEHNQDETLCPGCDKSCPLDPVANRHLCWSYKDCQKTCGSLPANKTCMKDMTPCSNLCIGGCSSPDSSHSCYVCRDFLFKKNCVDICPPDHYVLNGRRCVSKEECKNAKATGSRRYKAVPASSNSSVNLCIANCPTNFMESPDDPTSCVRCEPRCPKTCEIVRSVDSLTEAKKLMGCTIINGSLTIEIKTGDNVAALLEKYLSSIEEITGYLNLVRTPAVVSFNFLKNLRIIHGQTLHLEKYSLVVLDNMNLQEFWNWGEREEQKMSFTIKTGMLYFYHNERLCYQKIVELKNKAGLENLTLYDNDVSRATNGDRVSCDVFPLTLRVFEITADEATLEWDKPEETMTLLDDHRYLWAYTVFYMEMEDETANVTEFYGRDACGNDPWIAKDALLSTEGHSDKHMVFTLKDLQAYKRYAIYVKTNVITKSEKTAKSNITYFKTAMAMPSAPQNLNLEPTGSDSFKVTWEPPARPRGLANLYLITGEIQLDSAHSMSDVNYCSMSDTPSEAVTVKFPTQESPKNTTIEANIDCSKCKCDEGVAAKKKYTKENWHDAIDFEDLVHDLIFQKRDASAGLNESRTISKRDLVSVLKNDENEHENLIDNGTSAATSGKSNRDGSENATKLDYASNKRVQACPTDTSVEDEHRRVVKFCRWATEPQIPINRLRHFSQYIVTVRACHPISGVAHNYAAICDRQNRREGPNVTTMCCGPAKVAFKRTLKLAEADDIDFRSVQIEDEVNNSTDDFHQSGIFIRWNPPTSPNAFIQKYDIEFYMENNVNSKHSKCVDQTVYKIQRGSPVKGLAPGNYSFRVRATSVGGPGNWTQPKSFFVKDKGAKYMSLIISLIVIMLLLVISAGLALYFYIKKRVNQPVPDKVQYASINPEYMSQIYEQDEYEVPRHKVKLLHELGQGSFGMVWQGIVFDLKEPCDPNGTHCAVKTVKEGAKFHERQEFLKEASTMKSFDSYHVVKLLGVVSKDQPLYVIMELMSNGDLKRYLRSHRPDQDEPPKGDPPTLEQVLQMAAEIADGMAYLGSLKFVHRDLAARNCMVAEDLTVKIGDFGMTRDIYETDYYKKGGKGLLPVRWMSPEALKDGVFTVQGDVWSYGVVLWEIVTLATMPYQGLSHEQVLRWVISRHIMERPENCPDKLFEIMKRCWHYNPKLRPKFTDIVEMLLVDTHDRFRELSYYSTKVRSLERDEGPDGRARVPSVESLPLLPRPSSHIATTGLQSLIENPRNAVDMGAADLDEESNLYISDDVISDGEAEDSGQDNWANPSSHRRNQPGSSMPNHNNSDYGSGKSPPIPLLLETGDELNPSPLATASESDAAQPSSSPTTISSALPQELIAAGQAEKRNKVASNGTIQPNGRMVCIPINNRTTAF